MARGYLARGIDPGERIAVWAPNTWHWVVAALGAHYAGATLVSVNTRYTAHEALDILARTHARVLVVAAPFLGTDRLAELRELAGPNGLPGLHSVVQITPDGAGTAGGAFGWDEFAGLAAAVPGAEADAAAATVRPDHVSDILFTS